MKYVGQVAFAGFSVEVSQPIVWINKFSRFKIDSHAVDGEIPTRKILLKIS
ncbi:MAG: hypothetical protein CM15mP49_23980 [Actinomycetota bacterium]|nr:MAG: hypothetical protein CM15mP49_23980 [Actinomycetota bacterium]